MEKWEEAYRKWYGGDFILPQTPFQLGYEAGEAAERAKLAPVIEAAVKAADIAHGIMLANCMDLRVALRNAGLLDEPGKEAR